MKCSNSNCQLYLSTNIRISDPPTSNPKFLYQCDVFAKCILASHIDSPGYYVEGLPSITNGFNNLEYSGLIYCKNKEVFDCINISLSSGSNELYYIDRGTTGNIIKCASSKCVSIEGSGNGIGYRDEEKMVSPSSGVKHYQYIITCSDGICTSENKAEVIAANNDISALYFIDSQNSKNIITCQNDIVVQKILCSAPTTASANAQLIDGTDPNSTITCNQDPLNSGYASNCESASECRVTTGVGCTDKTYYLVKDTTNYFISATGPYLYYCVKDENAISGISCTQVEDVGYYVNTATKKFFSCTSSSSCVSETVGDGCTSSNIGKIFIDNNLKVALCLDYNSVGMSAPLNSLTPNYFIFFFNIG